MYRITPSDVDSIGVQVLDTFRDDLANNYSIKVDDDPLLAYMVTEKALTASECEVIRDCPTSAERMEKLIDCMSARLVPKMFKAFAKAVAVIMLLPDLHEEMTAEYGYRYCPSSV